MPLWDIHCSSELFSTEEKQTLAQQITKIYSSSGIPAFFVRVRFTCDPPDTVFTGGEKDAKFVHGNASHWHLVPCLVSGTSADLYPLLRTVQIWHLARNFTNSDHKNRFLKAVDVILNPFMESKGADWEYTVPSGWDEAFYY
jgi:hypothetical protein